VCGNLHACALVRNAVNVHSHSGVAALASLQHRRVA